MDKFGLITQTFDQVEADLHDRLQRGEIDEKQHCMEHAALLKQRIEKLCMEVPGFEDAFNRICKEAK